MSKKRVSLFTYPDNTLGTSEIVADSGTQNPINFASSSNTPLLVKKILAIDKHLQAYKGYIETLVTQSDLMVESYAVPWIEKSHALIINHLINDTGDNMNIADKPAYWGNQGDYRIIDLADGRNWYQARADAVNKALEPNQPIYESVYYRGVTNQWQATLMEQITNNIWTITVDNNQMLNSEGEPGFKFDIYADWSDNYGDDNADGIVNKSGANINFTDGFGNYLITFNALEKSYRVEKVTSTPVEDDAPILHAPVANAGADIEVFVGDTVHFDASNSTDLDGSIVSYHWSNNLSGASVFTVYSQVGTFEVMLTVTDNDNQMSTDSVVVTVVNKEEEPISDDLPKQEEPLPTEVNTSTSSGGTIYWLLVLLLFRAVFNSPLLYRLHIRSK